MMVLINTIKVHDALGLRYLIQLMVNLCPLRSHKRRHNFSFHAIQGVTLAVNVIDILQRKNLGHLGNQPELYLYGHPYPSLDLIDNILILLSTVRYVKDITRFSISVT